MWSGFPMVDIQTLVSSTARYETTQASTSGTAINFTTKLTGASSIVLTFSGVSTSGTDNWLVQIGSGSYTSTGYINNGGYIFGATCANSQFTTGFNIRSANSTNAISGFLQLELLDSSTNTWSCSGMLASGIDATTYITAGNVTLGGAIDRLRVTTTGGSQTFDAGSIGLKVWS